MGFKLTDVSPAARAKKVAGLKVGDRISRLGFKATQPFIDAVQGSRKGSVPANIPSALNTRQVGSIRNSPAGQIPRFLQGRAAPARTAARAGKLFPSNARKTRRR